MLNDIKLEAGIISLEAAAGTAGLFTAIDRLPGFVNNIRSFFLDAVGNENGEPVPSDYSRLAKKVANARYTDLTSLTVFVPPGLNVPYLTYLQQLERAEKVVLELPKTVLSPFSVWVARLLNNPHELGSVREQLEVQHMVLPDEGKLREEILGGVNGTDKSTERKYGKMVARNADWGMIERKLGELNHHLIADDRKRILRQVQDLVDNIDTLITRIKDDPEEYPISTNTLTLFSKTCYDVARVLELYAVYCYQLRLLTVAIEDTQKYLDKVLTRNAT